MIVRANFHTYMLRLVESWGYYYQSTTSNRSEVTIDTPARPCRPSAPAATLATRHTAPRSCGPAVREAAPTAPSTLTASILRQEQFCCLAGEEAEEDQYRFQRDPLDPHS